MSIENYNNQLRPSSQSIRAVSMLESAMCLVLFCSLLILSSCVWDYVDTCNGLSRIVDRYSNENKVKFHQYDIKANHYSIDLSDIRSWYSDRIAPRAFEELKNETRESRSSQLRLDFVFTNLFIDITNGEIRGIEPISENQIISYGQGDIPNFLIDGSISNGEVDFNIAILSYIGKFKDSLAIPTVSYGILGSSGRYLPEVPLIAVRAIYKYKNANILKTLRVVDEPYSWDIKVSPLRGEV